MGNPWVENYEAEKARTDRKLLFTLNPRKRQALKDDFCERFGTNGDYEDLSDDGEIAQDRKILHSFKKFAASGKMKQTIEAVESGPYRGDG